MPNLFHDRVKETTTGTGTGNLTLAGAVTGFASFASRFEVGEFIYYAIVEQSGTNWEVGRGHLSNATTFVRDVVHESSNTTGTPPTVVFSAVNFGAGTKDIFCTATADRLNEMFTQGQAVASASGLAMT